MQRWIIRLTLFGTFCLAVINPGFAQDNVITFTSEDGDYIGQGRPLVLTPGGSTFTATRNGDNSVTVRYRNERHFWTLSFAAPDDAELTPGSYENATRYPFQEASVPGLSISGNGRGCNTLTGRFDVLAASFGESGEVLTFNADFEQRCGSSTAALSGTVRFDAASLPLFGDGFEVEFRPKLFADDGASGDQFGAALAIDARTMIVGAPGEDDNGLNAGAAYLFVLRQGATNWSQQSKLTANDGSPDDRFGGAVAVAGDYLVIGAAHDDDRGGNAGAAYVFEDGPGGWTQAAKLTADDGAEFDYFGRAVAISGSRIAVGAWQDDDLGPNSGSVYIFERGANGSWSQSNKLTAADGATGDRFGAAVALDGNLLLISAPLAGEPLGDDPKRDAGAAYVFEFANDGWTQTAKLGAGAGSQDYLYGQSVAVDGGRLAVSAWRDNTNGRYSGSAFLYERAQGGWNLAARLSSDSSNINDLSGGSIALLGDTLLLGVALDDDDSANAGSAFLFQHRNGSWQQVVQLTATTVAPGQDEDVAGARFGWSVAIGDAHLAVGAVSANGTTDASDAGAVYVVER